LGFFVSKPGKLSRRQNTERTVKLRGKEKVGRFYLASSWKPGGIGGRGGRFAGDTWMGFREGPRVRGKESLGCGQKGEIYSITNLSAKEGTPKWSG